MCGQAGGETLVRQLQTLRCQRFEHACDAQLRIGGAQVEVGMRGFFGNLQVNARELGLNETLLSVAAEKAAPRVRQPRCHLGTARVKRAGQGNQARQLGVAQCRVARCTSDCVSRRIAIYRGQG